MTPRLVGGDPAWLGAVLRRELTLPEEGRGAGGGAVAQAMRGAGLGSRRPAGRAGDPPAATPRPAGSRPGEHRCSKAICSSLPVPTREGRWQRQCFPSSSTVLPFSPRPQTPARSPGAQARPPRAASEDLPGLCCRGAAGPGRPPDACAGSRSADSLRKQEPGRRGPRPCGSSAGHACCFGASLPSRACCPPGFTECAAIFSRGCLESDY